MKYRVIQHAKGDSIYYVIERLVLPFYWLGVNSEGRLDSFPHRYMHKKSAIKMVKAFEEQRKKNNQKSSIAMKPKELRIGNWVNYCGKQREWELADFVDSWNDHNAHEFYDDIHPIPLTEEWLKKFGFECLASDGKITIYSNLHFEIHFSIEGVDVCYLVGDGNENTFEIERIDYLHQLQNLYFALTGGEEL